MRNRFLWVAGAFLFFQPACAMTFATEQGTDSATCGAVASPCRTAQRAVTNEAAGGYVVLQGPADFGRASIDKALTVVGEGGATLDGAGAPDNEGVVAVAAGANDTVRVRGLTIINAPPRGAAISAVSAKRLEIADCVIRQLPFTSGAFPGAGVMTMFPDGGRLVVIDTSIDAPRGVFAGSQSQPISSYLDGLQISSSEAGVWMGQGSSLNPMTVVVNSSVTKASIGLRSLSGDLIVRNSTVSNGWDALVLDSSAIQLSRMMITGNARAAYAPHATGALMTFGDNAIRGNTDDALPRMQSTSYH